MDGRVEAVEVPARADEGIGPYALWGSAYERRALPASGAFVSAADIYVIAITSTGGDGGVWAPRPTQKFRSRA